MSRNAVVVDNLSISYPFALKSGTGRVSDGVVLRVLEMKRREFRSTIRRVRSFLGSRIVRPLAITPLASGFRRKRISAMMRVKNEEAFLRASAESILPLVDEIVIIDNDSTDATPRIARDLARSHPGKIRVCHYPHAVARV